MNSKSVSSDTPFCPVTATPLDAPSAYIEQQITQGHSQEIQSSSPDNEVPKKQMSS